jgi:hypothetical protein
MRVFICQSDQMSESDDTSDSEDDVDLSLMRNDECIAYLQQTKVSCLDIYSLIGDSRIPLMEWFYTKIDVVDGCMHLKLMPDDIVKVYHASYFFEKLISNCQIRALDNFLRMCIENGITCKINGHLMEFATTNGKTAVFDWVDSNAQSLVITKMDRFISSSIEHSMMCGDIDGLEMHLQRHQFKYNMILLGTNPIEVLQWLLDHYLSSQIEFIYDEFTISCTSTPYENSDPEYVDIILEILDWFYLKCNRHSIPFLFRSNTTAREHVRIHDWFWDRRHDIEFIVDDGMIDELFEDSSTSEVIDWLYAHSPEIKFEYTEDAVDNGMLIHIQWLWDRRSDLEFKYSIASINDSLYTWNIDKLMWFYDKRDIIEFKYDPYIIIHTPLAQFWIYKITEFPAKISIKTAYSLIGDNSIELIEFILDNVDSFIFDNTIIVDLLQEYHSNNNE